MSLSCRGGQQPREKNFVPHEILACLPERLHPVSALILDSFLSGRITLDQFKWGFHLPNSTYLPVAECILNALSS